MDTAQQILDDAQEYLHDDGTLWSRAELLDYLNDGYKRILTETSAIRALLCLDVPPRYPYVISHAWERQSVTGTPRQWTWPTTTRGQYDCAHRWEIEHLAGATPTDGDAGCTQAWERLYSITVDRPDRYICSTDHLRTYRMSYNGIRLFTASPQELDEYSRLWETQTGLPAWYHGDLGDVKQFGLYLSVTVDGQTSQATGGAVGVVRGWSGSQTYAFLGEFTQGYAFTSTGDHSNPGFLTGPGYKFTTDTTVAADYQAVQSWEKQHVESATVTAGAAYVFVHPWEFRYAGLSERTVASVGTVRDATGLRQYVMTAGEDMGNGALGTIRSWTGNTNNLLVDYAVTSPTLIEAESPSLLPAPFSKYLRFYVLSLAFGREGEGHQPDLSKHFFQRFMLGLNFLKQVANFAMKTRAYQAQAPVAIMARPPRPRLPSTYPRVH